MTSWADYLPPRKPFYRRTLFLALAFSFLIIGGVGFTLAWAEMEKWQRKAQAFDYSKLTEMESASLIFDRQNQIMGRIFIQNRDEVPLEKLSKNLLTAVVGAEDARFYRHHGVDYFGIA